MTEPISEFELAYLLIETVGLAGSLFFGAISIMTGFVVIGLFFGQMLNRVMTWMLIGGYSLVALVTAVQLNRIWSNFVGIAFEIKARHAETGAFEWHAIVDTPKWFLSTGPFFVAVLVIVAYIGTLIFFFQTRKIDPKEFR